MYLEFRTLYEHRIECVLSEREHTLTQRRLLVCGQIIITHNEI